MVGLSELQKQLLTKFQKNFPLTPHPYAEMAKQLGVQEHDVVEALQQLEDTNVLSRVGPVLRPNAGGASTLVAIAVEKEKVEEVARFINSFSEVNHNYERNHYYNLWFVLNASSESRIHEVIHEIETNVGSVALNLPLQKEYHIDLGFGLLWN